ncbi:spermatogenesis-associated protein 31D1-like isoform X1 [Heterocephalus glaber]|uniref:Spermatogenesis-associated protein 31D1-like isoform X1 n=1 Tax=Heterocephalus glaber TaxID=10181 RepID=A0AAX6R2X4_HETGA|nr:spermatogenesis-associated protein 31D1-like isoform X1 [Heterocephalus glaber]
MVCDLPHKIQKSTEIFSTKKDPSLALSDSHFPTSDNSVSGVHPKIGVYKSPRGGANAFQAQNVITTKSVLNGPCPVSSSVSKEGQGRLKRSHSSTKHELTSNIWAAKDGTQTFLPPGHNNVDKSSQKQILQAKRRSPRPPTRLAGARPEIRDKGMSSRRDTEMLQKKTTVKLEHFSVCDQSKETFKAQELCVPQSQPSNILMTSKSGGILGRDVRTSKPETPPTTERPLRRTAVSQDLKSSSCKNKPFKELKFEMRAGSKARFGAYTLMCPLPPVT